MKPSFTKVILAIALLIFVLCACSTKQPDVSNDLQKIFGEMIPISNMNSHLRVKVIKGDHHKFGSDVSILIENISNSPIYFSADPKSPFVKIFIIENNKWIEIENKATYFSLTGGDGYTLSPPNGEQPNIFTSSVRPVLEPSVQDGGKQVIVRIVVFGELVSNDKETGTPVAAYVDLFMEP